MLTGLCHHSVLISLVLKLNTRDPFQYSHLVTISALVAASAVLYVAFGAEMPGTFP